MSVLVVSAVVVALIVALRRMMTLSSLPDPAICNIHGHDWLPAKGVRKVCNQCGKASLLMPRRGMAKGESKFMWSRD